MFAIVMFISIVSSANYPLPRDKYVNDFAGVLNASDQAELRDVFSQVETESTAEMVFVSVDNLSGQSIDQYTFELASEWKVGKSDKDNGLVILYAVSENKIWVASGYGIEGILPDSKIGRFLDDYYVPSRDSGEVQNGIMLVSEKFAEELINNKEEIKSGQGASRDRVQTIMIIIIIAVILIIIIGSIINRSKYGRSRGWGGYYGGGGFHGGGGGGGFGGGGFGGGGAGR